MKVAAIPLNVRPENVGITQRAYSVLEIKSFDEDQRVITGIATTPTPDRMGDIVETEGIQFQSELPLLYQHDAKNPIGWVTEAKASKNGIAITARILEAGKDPDVDKAWNKIKHKLVRGLSIGFRTIDEEFDKAIKGFRILKSEWLELSAVTIPANAEATITSVKAFDTNPSPAFGIKGDSVIHIDSRPSAGVSAHLKVKNMTIKEQITAFENKRAATDAAMEALMAKAADTDSTLDAADSEKYDSLAVELKSVDEHIDRLKTREKSILAKTTTVAPIQATPAEVTAAAASRSTGHVVTVKKIDPPGIGMARVAMALTGAKGNVFYAQHIARERWPDNPELVDAIKAVIEAGDTTTSGWASQLVPNAVQESFIGMLRPMTIFGKIAGFKRVPFNTVVPIQSTGGTYQWVGEAAPKPVSALAFTSATLRWGKIAGIIVITQELARFSSPSAEALVRDDMLEGLARYVDTQFVGSAAAVSNVSPAGILNGIGATTPSSTTAAAFLTDMNNMLNNFTANNVDLTRLTLLMSSTSALAISLMTTSLGVPLYPSLGINGGTVFGIPVIVSENVGTKIIAIDASQILVADDGGIAIDVSTEASVEMSSTPILGDTSPITGATVKSLWQNNLVGLRVEKFITWVAARTAAVEYLSPVAYVP